MAKQIKLLVVDDSALMRRHLVNLFEAEGDFAIAIARNGKEAVESLTTFQPDVVTLDINMPEMDGLTALSMMMNIRPTPIVMVSSLTEKGALATFEALALGAVDFIAKPGGTISLSIDQVGEAIVTKVRTAATVRLNKKNSGQPGKRSFEKVAPRIAKNPGLRSDARKTAVASLIAAKEPSPLFQSPFIGLVLIGVSTGGPKTLESIIPQLPGDFPWPVIVAQHMPPSFTAAFADRMDKMSALSVVEVAKPMEIQRGMVYIGKGGTDVCIGKRFDKKIVMPKPEDTDHLWHPSVERMVRSAMEHFSAQNIIGVMLTGMGNDGAHAMSELRRQNGRTIAESEESAVVFGMPQELIKLGGALEVKSSEEIAQLLIQWLS